LNAKEKENEPKERKTLSQGVNTVRASPRTPLQVNRKYFIFIKNVLQLKLKESDKGKNVAT